MHGLLKRLTCHQGSERLLTSKQHCDYALKPSFLCKVDKLFFAMFKSDAHQDKYGKTSYNGRNHTAQLTVRRVFSMLRSIHVSGATSPEGAQQAGTKYYAGKLILGWLGR